MKVVFFGTPQFAVEPLRQVYSSRHKILGVVTQLDRAKNRRGEFIESEVKKEALSLNLPVFQFESVKKDGCETLKSLNADIFITAGYGQLFNAEILSIPKYGIINVHASLLPKYRGSSPVQWAIMSGETQTGVTIMQTDLGLDTGDILLSEICEVAPLDTTQTLTNKLSALGAELLINALDSIENGAVRPIKQNEKEATKFPLLTKETGKIDFCDTAINIYNKIRAINCYTFIQGKYVKILDSRIIDENSLGKTGEIIEGLIIQCQKGRLEIIKLQPENKKPMYAKEYICGYKIQKGDIIG